MGLRSLRAVVSNWPPHDLERGGLLAGSLGAGTSALMTGTPPLTARGVDTDLAVADT